MKILDNNIAVLENDDYVARWIVETGRLDHDQNTLPQILPFIKEGDAVVDVGAFIGDHTHAYLRAVGETGTVLAFEPNIEAFACLKHNCPRAICMSIALSDVAEHMAPDNPGRNPGAMSLVRGLGIMTSPLDNFQLGDIHLIKLDCEGMELKVLFGARRTIAKFHPIIVCEINKGTLWKFNTEPRDVFCELRHMGYKRIRNLYEEQPMTGEQFDIIALP